MDKFRNMKKSHIALLVVMYMVLMGSFPRFTGWATIFRPLQWEVIFKEQKRLKRTN